VLLGWSSVPARATLAVRMFANALTRARDILTIFREAQRLGRQEDRHWSWVARAAARKREHGDGWPAVVGGMARCRDGWTFRVLPRITTAGNQDA